MAKTVELVIDVPAVVSSIAEQYKLKIPRKIVMFHYDDSATPSMCISSTPQRALTAKSWMTSEK